MKVIVCHAACIVICSFLAAACTPASDLTNELPTKTDLQEYLVDDVGVHEKYEVIKLPLTGDVTIWNPVQIVRGPDNIMYVANNTGEIYRLIDSDGDGIEDRTVLFCDVRKEGLRSPAGLEFKDGRLYVGTSNQIRIYMDSDGNGQADSSYVYFNDIPYSDHPYEWTSGLVFDGDGRLYFVLTTDSWNASPAPDPDGLRGALLRLEDSQLEVVSTGLRSVPSMSFDAHGSLFFIDNEGGGNPTEELNLAVKDAFYGHNPDKYNDHPAVTTPVFDLKFDVAPSGIVFADPDDSGQDMFVSYYGPGERWERGSVSKVRIKRDGNGNYLFEEVPIVSDLAKLSDIALGSDGSIYVTQVGITDYWYQAKDEPDGAVYRLVPASWVVPETYIPDRKTVENADATSLARGEKLFTDRVCSACHATDGKTELLGPNLKDISRVYSRKELLEEIMDPNKRIKPGMAPTRLVLNNGDVLIGRVDNANEDQVRIMIIGNKIVDVSRQDIVEEEIVMQSLMYEGLLNGASEEDKNALLDYLLSLNDSNE